MTPERRVKNSVVEILQLFDAYYFYPVSGGYGVSGVPDIIVCYKGRFIAIECKAGTNKVSALQYQNITRIKYAGGVALVINENNILDVQLTLEEIRRFYGE